MRRIWLGNCNSEYRVDRLEELDPREREGTPVVAARMVWLLREGDALVLPQPVDPAFVAHVGALMGFDPRRVDLLTPQDRSGWVLGREVLHRPELLDRLRKLVAGTGPWEICSYLSDRSIASLARELDLTDGSVSGFDAAGSAELFNSKAVFRALAAGLDVPAPAGAVCGTSGDLHSALDRLATETGAVIVKGDRAGGGAGNLLCRTNSGIIPAGAAHILPRTGAQDRAAIVARTGLVATHAPRGQVVAETYHPGCRSLCLEVLCPEPASGPPQVVQQRWADAVMAVAFEDLPPVAGFPVVPGRFRPSPAQLSRKRREFYGPDLRSPCQFCRLQGHPEAPSPRRPGSLAPTGPAGSSVLARSPRRPPRTNCSCRSLP